VWLAGQSPVLARVEGMVVSASRKRGDLSTLIVNASYRRDSRTFRRSGALVGNPSFAVEGSPHVSVPLLLRPRAWEAAARQGIRIARSPDELVAIVKDFGR